MKPRPEKNKHDFILKSAVKVATEVGREKIRFDLVADEIGMDRSIIYHYFENTEELKKLVLRYAIDNDVIILLIEALLFNKIDKKDLSPSTLKKISEFFV